MQDSASPIVPLFKALGSPHRLLFLAEMQVGPRSPSQLARIAGISVQEGMRHVANLREIGLVEPARKRHYTLTPLGAIVAGPLRDCEALMRHREFFANHDASFVPPHLSLAPLLGTPRSTADEATHLRDLAASAARSEEFLYTVSGQMVWNDLPGLVGERPPARLREWRGVFTPNVLVSEAFLKLPALIGRMSDPSRLRIRMAVRPELPFLLSVNEAEGWLFLRHRVGLLDLANATRSETTTFRDWAVGLFLNVEAGARTVFDTARGDRLSEWEHAMRNSSARPAFPPGTSLMPQVPTDAPP